MNHEKSAQEILKNIETTSTRLVENLNEIVDRSQPEKIVAKQVQNLKNFYLDEHGGIRMDRAGKTLAAVVGLAVLRKLFK
ncbi:MAG: hypothetical protein RLZZ508_1064 [Actinomycetota bacterium]|jgi:hypothetical protein